MSKLFNLACVMLATVFTFPLTSCGDDKDEVENNKFTIVGTWRAEKALGIVINGEHPTTTYMVFYSDFTFYSYDKVNGKNVKNLELDKDSIFYKEKGIYSITGDYLTAQVTSEYCYENFRDWEWHDVTDTPNTLKIKVISKNEISLSESYGDYDDTIMYLYRE